MSNVSWSCFRLYKNIVRHILCFVIIAIDDLLQNITNMDKNAVKTKSSHWYPNDEISHVILDMWWFLFVYLVIYLFIYFPMRGLSLAKRTPPPPELIKT